MSVIVVSSVICPGAAYVTDVPSSDDSVPGPFRLHVMGLPVKLFPLRSLSVAVSVNVSPGIRTKLAGKIVRTVAFLVATPVGKTNPVEVTVLLEYPAVPGNVAVIVTVVFTSTSGASYVVEEPVAEDSVPGPVVLQVTMLEGADDGVSAAVKVSVPFDPTSKVDGVMVSVVRTAFCGVTNAVAVAELPW